MDRNGKKPKAVPDASSHPERSDTKADARATSGRIAADARNLPGRGERGAAPDTSGPRSKGARR